MVNSLFEDNAEFGYGMLLAQKADPQRLKTKVESVMANENASEEVKAACKEWLDTFNSGITNGAATDKLVAALEGVDCDVCKDIVKNKDFLAKKSQWVFGGDGWAIRHRFPAVLTMYWLPDRISQRNGIRYRSLFQYRWTVF